MHGAMLGFAPLLACALGDLQRVRDCSALLFDCDGGLGQSGRPVDPVGRAEGSRRSRQSE
jgi:hypothetical protein